MAIAITYSRASTGIEAPIVMVETHISNGLPKLHIVGLPETVVRESKDRVRSAILNSNFEFPARRITINLAPADLPKDGGRFDLAIAVGILAASSQLSCEHLYDFEFGAELALSGQLRAFQGVLSFALATKRSGRSLIIPHDNAKEAALAGSSSILPAHHLLDVCAHLVGKKILVPYPCDQLAQNTTSGQDLKYVKGQQRAKRALEIAAAGGHSLLFSGPPGTGKTLLSSCLPGILPIMSQQEALEVAMINSLASKQVDSDLWFKRPFRHPHHTASCHALVGGGNPPKPGEISLAHNGVLFLDELPEFKRHVLESLREPLETGHVTISRACHQLQFPARFQLLAAMNPCPCGYFGSTQHECQCTHEQIKKYQNKISGPLLDRIDLQVEVLPLPILEFYTQTANAEPSAVIRSRVEQARVMQLTRQTELNVFLKNKDLLSTCKLSRSNQEFMEDMIKRLKFSVRSYYKILKIARTIADLENCEDLKKIHLKEALSYRYFDNTNPTKLAKY